MEAAASEGKALAQSAQEQLELQRQQRVERRIAHASRIAREADGSVGGVGEMATLDSRRCTMLLRRAMCVAQCASAVCERVPVVSL